MKQLLARLIKPSATNGDVLTTVSGKTAWAAATSGGATTLDGLSDVDTTTVTPASGQVLKFNGTLWTPGTDNTSTSGGGSTIQDRRWAVPAGVTSLDEFNDATLDPAWVQLNTAGAPAGNVAWVEAADVLSVVNNGGDTAGNIHSMVRPLGTALAPGDALLTCVTIFAPNATNYTMSGLVLSDSATAGAGNQIVAMPYIQTGTPAMLELWQFAGWSGGSLVTSGTAFSSLPYPIPMFMRLIYTAANTWRIDVSLDGVGWRKNGTMTKAIAPTHVGFISSSWGTSTKHALTYEFLRRASGVS